MLVKIYGNEPQTGEVRYSPAQCMGARKAAITGQPDVHHIFPRRTLNDRT
jgi:hypothetical protein